MNRLNFLLPLTIETNFKPLLSEGNHFLKKMQLGFAWKSYRRAFDNLWTSWGTFNNSYYWPEMTFVPNSQYRFIYCPIPKVASTSFKELILRLNGL